MSFREKCAVVGVWNHKEASFLCYLGLYALQHRGQEGAGIASLVENQHLICKGRGLVKDVFNESNLNTLQGRVSIGHTRYSTKGSDEIKNIQPLCHNLNNIGQVSVAHNGNITNYSKLEKKHPNLKFSESDTECIFPLLENCKSKNLGQMLIEALSQLDGAFSLVFLIKDKLVAARDPRGFRPLVIGKKDEAYIFASETCALDLIGAEYIREVKPGEIVIADNKGLQSYMMPSKPLARCVFEYVYFARPDSSVFGNHVYQKRKLMGRLLAREHPVDADLVIPVPDSGVPASIGYAEESGIPFDMGIIRNHYIGRTFINPLHSIRNFNVKVKLNPQSELIRDKRVVVVDDSIVRGTTSQSLIQVLRQAGAKEVHMRVSSPPIQGSCFYGIDTPKKTEFIYKKYSDIKELAKYFQADSIGYLSLNNLKKSAGESGFCYACFNEEYPTPIEETC